jgi:serine phosphatase RsbU (regulator of sigma subunit)
MLARDFTAFIPARNAGHACAADLCSNTPVVSAADTNATVRTLFDKNRELISLPVVDVNKPVGLINRHTFLSEMAKPYRRELHDRKSCVVFMDPAPLIVDATTTLERTAILIVETQQKALSDGFLIVRDGEFLGFGSGLDLMRKVADLQAEKNRQIMQSITYASVIQLAMLRNSLETLSAELNDAGLVWEPRDTVGGDFYHCEKFDDGLFIAIADCTGHGVPGAFMTLISSSWLKQELDQHGPRDPARLMSELNRQIKLSLGQTQTHDTPGQSDDGLDALFAWFDRKQMQLTFAGARIPLHIIAPGQDVARTLDTDRVGIGYVGTPMDHRWSNQTLALEQGTVLCTTSDGFTDQIGGPKHIAFGKRRLRSSMSSNRGLPMDKFAQALMADHRGHQARQRRRDDLTLLCLRV